ncbi:class I adenylate-forming enzyme family protein [Oceanibacterium hippocampi]|uniref:Long-chain-fatty-acid--CoA ligase n=1 Tax=Oceanibacterium hippocampi TaxID=745714 RepID=A0A1Y5TK39_9PROT|nr:AMP-binding protein [Oceanibacterium hippocampi]SLN63808.1 Long-chain-fatty-acid--CoA ligase [Oceanibacterium hippocampi]
MNPFRDLTYAESISLVAERYGDREAVVFRDERYSFADVKVQVDRASARFASLGLRPDDKVAILLPNRPEFIWYWLGASQMGLVAVMLNTRLRKDELAYQLAQSDSRAVIVPGDGAFRDVLGELSELAPALLTGEPGKLGSEQLPELAYVIAVDPFDERYSGALDWSKPGPADLPMPPMERDGSKPGSIVYSSGTTALPKGAMITHCVWRKAWDIGDRVDLTEDDVLYMAIPLFGSMATLNGVLPYLVRGARQVIGEQFDAGACLRAIEKEKVTGIHLLALSVDQLIRHPDFDKYDRSSLRISYTLSIDPAVLDAVADVIGVPGVMTGYGLTETTTVATRNRWDDPRDIRHTTQGWALPDVEIKIVDSETLDELPPDSPGEIWVRGYCTMAGYYKKPAETAACLRDDGWFRTGDLGQLDATGRVRLFGRLGDGYKSRGFNVFPEEIEQVVNRHPAVAASSVVGVPDPLADMIGAVFVILKDGAGLTADELIAFLKPKLAGFKMPGHVFFVDTFPLTSGTGKVQKFRLREMAAERLGLPAPVGRNKQQTQRAGA